MNNAVAKFSFMATVSAAVILLGMAQAQAAEPLKIGYVGGISGPCGINTATAIKNMKMATDEINEAGGILGRPVEVIYRDSKTRPDEGAKQARDLIVSEKVEILTGVCSSSVLLSVNAVSKEYNVPLFSAIGATHEATIQYGHQAVFQTQPTTLMESSALAQFTVQQSWKRIVTIALDYSWGRTTVAAYKERLQQLDPTTKVIRELWPKIGESNMTSFITAAMSEKPDAILAVTFGVTTNSLVKQGESYGLFKRTNVLTLLVYETLMSMGENFPDGVYGWSRAPFNALNTENGVEYVKRYRVRHNGEYPADFGVLGYDVMHYIAEVVKRAGGTDAAKMSAAAANFTFDSVRGPLHSRAIDNTLNAPSYVGVSKKLPEYPFSVLVDVQRISGDLTLPSEEEVKRLRATVQ